MEKMQKTLALMQKTRVATENMPEACMMAHRGTPSLYCLLWKENFHNRAKQVQINTLGQNWPKDKPVRSSRHGHDLGSHYVWCEVRTSRNPTLWHHNDMMWQCHQMLRWLFQICLTMFLTDVSRRGATTPFTLKETLLNYLWRKPFFFQQDSMLPQSLGSVEVEKHILKLACSTESAVNSQWPWWMSYTVWVFFLFRVRPTLSFPPSQLAVSQVFTHKGLVKNVLLVLVYYSFYKGLYKQHLLL